MPKKIIILIAVILLVLAGGFLWRNLDRAGLNQGQEPEAESAPEGLAGELLFGLKKNFDWDFSAIRPINFQWNAVDQDENVSQRTIAGQGIELAEVSFDQREKIDSYFQENGFLVDKYNLADGTAGSLIGYKKDYLICQVSSLLRLDDQGAPTGEGINDLFINCAEADFDPSPELSAETAVKKLLADKYGKKSVEVDLTVSQAAEEHLKGEVVFEPGGPENSGIFLAAKIDGQWQLVFDGNGSFSCQMLEDYDFPEEMKQGCASQPGSEEPILN